MQQPLSDDELEAQSAADLPDREALSLIDPGTLLGGTGTGTALPTSSPTGSSTPSSGTPAPTDSVSLPGGLDNLSNKFISTGGTSNG